EGYTPTDLLNDEQVLSLIAGDYENEKYCKINYSVPKFDISSNTDLEKGLKNLGVTEIFNEGADFTPLTSDTAFIGKAEQGARVVIDERGCKAAAYTAMLLMGSGIPSEEIDMTLDRPFLFVIHGYDGAPLFIGVVNNPAK
ncbi:MAG: serpin family protein, partial [Clostridia bacterium]|nr:serpin family protein [Clostridia bacterium]